MRIARRLVVVVVGLLWLDRSHSLRPFIFSRRRRQLPSSTRILEASTTRLVEPSSPDASASTTTTTTTTNNNNFVLQKPFTTECDDVNHPPSLNILLRTLSQLTSTGSDIRGEFVDHARVGSYSKIAHDIASSASQYPPLTPIACYCLGIALVRYLQDMTATDTGGGAAAGGAAAGGGGASDNSSTSPIIIIAIGVDPRWHGKRLADSLARGIQASGATAMFTHLATTPGMAKLVELQNLSASIMVTASHLPPNRNGLKVFLRNRGGLTKQQVQQWGMYAREVAIALFFGSTVIPPSSKDPELVACTHVNWMPLYATTLRDAIIHQVQEDSSSQQPLQGLKIVVNAGHGSGGFFEQVLQELGADTSSSMELEPDPTFPRGVPNPEDPRMVQRTIAQCAAAQADLGILLDTDADRCGFVVPNPTDGTYEALNRNRLIALLAVIFAQKSPGCAIVTDSVTSEGLSQFIVKDLGLIHVRYLKGYANVINKAKELTAAGMCNAEVAIETSGHCAMKENNYLDDGTYTAVKIVSLLAQGYHRAAAAGGGGGGGVSLLDKISNLKELPEVVELRMTTYDQSIETMEQVFDFCALEMERLCDSQQEPGTETWELDTENLEGVRVRIGHDQFLMLRKSLHDPIISLQIEALSRDVARQQIVAPLLHVFDSEPAIQQELNVDVLRNY